MTTFDDREQAFEKKFALDQDLKFKVEARRNKMLGEWAAEKLGIADAAAVKGYVKAVQKADLTAKGDNDVFHKLRKDFDDNGLAVSDRQIRKKMAELLAQAVAAVEAGKA